MTNSIAIERERLGLSKSQLAVCFGEKRSTVAEWESDPSHIDGSVLCKLSDFFGCSIDYLLGLTDKRVPED